MLPNFSYVRPNTLAEAIRQLGTPQAKAHAGGTDLVGCLRDGVFEVRHVVSLSGLPGLRDIADSSAGLRIGALTRIAALARHALVEERYSALARAAQSVGSPQLRNQGTVGGNLCQRPRCWYFRGDFQCLRNGGDTCFAMHGDDRYHCIFGGGACLTVHPSDIATALVAFGARVTIAGPRGTRTMPIESFFVLPAQDPTKENVLGPAEILTDVVVPAPPAGLVSTYRKVRGRGTWDFATASLAVALSVRQGRVENARIVLGAAAPIPWRAREAEQVLIGRTLDPKTIGMATAAAVRGAEPRGQNGYKVAMFRGLLQEVLEGLSPTSKTAGD
jgi:xanthine dehydrogenase YagS FAD-binding subunit